MRNNSEKLFQTYEAGSFLRQFNDFEVGIMKETHKHFCDTSPLPNARYIYNGLINLQDLELFRNATVNETDSFTTESSIAYGTVVNIQKRKLAPANLSLKLADFNNFSQILPHLTAIYGLKHKDDNSYYGGLETEESRLVRRQVVREAVSDSLFRAAYTNMQRVFALRETEELIPNISLFKNPYPAEIMGKLVGLDYDSKNNAVLINILNQAADVEQVELDRAFDIKISDTASSKNQRIAKWLASSMFRGLKR